MRARGIIRALASYAVLTAFGLTGVVLAETPSRALTGNAGAVEMPGIGRVLLAFALTLGVGVASIVALRRALPWLRPRLAGQPFDADAPRLLGSRTVHAGLKLHVIETNGVTVLVAESRGGVAMTVLPPKSSAPPNLREHK